MECGVRRTRRHRADTGLLSSRILIRHVSAGWLELGSPMVHVQNHTRFLSRVTLNEHYHRTASDCQESPEFPPAVALVSEVILTAD